MLVALWAVVGYGALQSYRQAVREHTADLVQAVSIAEEQAAQTFSMLKIALVAADYWVGRHPDEDPGENAEFVALVEALRQASGRRVDVRMVTREARLAYVPRRDDAAATDVSDREYFTAQRDPAKRGFYIAASVLSRVTKKWGIPVSVPASGDGRIAVLYGAIELDILEKLQTPLLRGREAQILLVRGDGTVLSRVPFAAEAIGRKLGELPLWREQLSRQASGSFVSDDASLADEKQLVAFSRLRDYPLTVVAVAPLEAGLKAWRAREAVVAAAALLLSVVVSLLALRLARAVTDGEATRRQLERTNAELALLSVTDRLTQVYNRVRLDAVLEQETSRAARYGSELALIVVDIDRFKEVNDRHGHHLGDTVLVAVAAILRAQVRETDTLGRWGGEEFVVILPQTSAENAREVAEKLRLAVAGAEFPAIGTLSASFGVTGYHRGESDSEFLARADAALYAAKNAGRNRVVLQRRPPPTD